MKKISLVMILAIIAATSFGQAAWELNFEVSWYLNRIYKDTISSQNYSWQIGQPSKGVFNSAYSVPNAIVTDTLNPVPANDTSTFYLIHQRDNTGPFHIFGLSFWYQLDGDSTDFGRIEVSPDGGINWIDMLTQDSIYQFYWMLPKPTLSGSTIGWEAFSVNMENWASAQWGFPILMTADTILFRFTYITDSSSTAHDGWIIDNFHLEDWWSGIDEIRDDNLISISPNPTSDKLTILRVKGSYDCTIQIMNSSGNMVFYNTSFFLESIDTKQFKNGIYFLKYSDSKSFAVKRFVVQH